MKSYSHVTTLLDIVANNELPTVLRYWQGLVWSNEKIISANCVRLYYFIVKKET